MCGRPSSAHPHRGRVDPAGKENLKIEVEVIGLKTQPRNGRCGVRSGDDPKLVGEVVTLVPASTEGMLRRKSTKIWSRNTPGAWLTHSKPSGPRADLPAEVADDLDGLHKRTVGSTGPRRIDAQRWPTRPNAPAEKCSSSRPIKGDSVWCRRAWIRQNLALG